MKDRLSVDRRAGRPSQIGIDKDEDRFGFGCDVESGRMRLLISSTARLVMLFLVRLKRCAIFELCSLVRIELSFCSLLGEDPWPPPSWIPVDAMKKKRKKKSKQRRAEAVYIGDGISINGVKRNARFRHLGMV